MDKNSVAVAVFDKLAKLYEQKFMDVTLYRESFDFFCDHLQHGEAELLELACGPGNITQYLLNKKPGLKILATDMSQNMINLALANNPTISVAILDSRHMSTLTKTYDGIVCGFCLPYLSKEEAVELIKDGSKILRAGGLFYISTMEDDYVKSAYKKGSTGDEVFMHFHEAAYLSEAIDNTNMKIIYLERKKYPGPDGTETTDLLIVAEKIGS